MMVVFLVTLVWSLNVPSPAANIEAEPDLKTCWNLAASFDKAMDDDNSVNMPAFVQDYRAMCITITPSDGPDVRGPI